MKALIKNLFQMADNAVEVTYHRLHHSVGKFPFAGSMDSDVYKVFIEHFLLPQLWIGAVVVMDNLPAHHVAEIKPLIEGVGASVLYLSPYSPEFNPIEHWWSQ